MNQHKKTGLRALSTAELRVRREELVAALPYAGAFLAGSTVEQRRRCGKERCRCAHGESHGPYVYLQVGSRLVYVPAMLAETVRSHVEVSGRLRALLGEISDINLELLSRRELD
jgi:hypothetical protein